MTVLVATAISLVVGVLGTLAISKFYYERGNKKSLTPYIGYAMSVFGGMDPLLREKLKIRYEDVEVEDMYQVVVLVLNDGFRPIKDVIEPLSLTVGEGAEVLDARVVHIDPDGRSVDAKIATASDPARVEFDFPLLNRGDYFLTKVLYRADLTTDLTAADMRFAITVDDLPPELETESFFRLNTSQKSGVSWAEIGIGALIMLVAVAMSYVILLAGQAMPTAFPFSFLDGTFDVLATPAALLAGLAAILIFLFGLALVVTEGFKRSVGGIFQQTPPVKLPEGVPQFPAPFMHAPPYIDSSHEGFGHEGESE